MLAWSAGGTAQDLAARLAGIPRPRRCPGLAGADALWLACDSALRGAAPFILAALSAGVAATVLQTGFLINGSRLQPDFSRISPRAGLRRLFGLDNLMEAAKSIAKVAVMAFVLWRVLQADLPALMQAPRWDAAGAADAHHAAGAAHAVRRAGGAGGDRRLRPVLGRGCATRSSCA